jgi:hypothetical protein
MAGPRLHDAALSILELGRGHNSSAGRSTVQIKAAMIQKMRVILLSEFAMQRRWRVAMNIIPPLKATLWLEEITANPSPLCIRK